MLLCAAIIFISTLMLSRFSWTFQWYFNSKLCEFTLGACSPQKKFLYSMLARNIYHNSFNNHRKICYLENQSQSQFINEIQLQLSQPVKPIFLHTLTILRNCKNIALHIFRFFYLLLIFLPPMLLLPLRYFKRTQWIWTNTFVKSVQQAGVVWIKVFQYLSHRRDIIGPEMADSFIHLREQAPQHSFEDTKKSVQSSFGRPIQEIFEQFDYEPIASGSVSQVYKAVYNGKAVAVKVRHPQVQTYIQRDVNLLFFISRFLSLFSKAYDIPVSQASLKKTLIDQIDFTIQSQNLLQFNTMFKNHKQVSFPKPIQQATRQNVLVESFVQGKPITHYEQNRHQLNPVIARLGAAAFFEMLIKNNLIHADCHGGNILVEVTPKRSSTLSLLGTGADNLRKIFRKMEFKLKEKLLDDGTLKQLYRDNYKQQEKIRQIMRQCKEQAKISLIDVGMVIRLNEQDRINFIQFIKSIIESKSQVCAQMIFNLSRYEGRKIQYKDKRGYLNQLTKLFSVLNNRSIFDMDGMALLVGMLDIIRVHNMQLQGEFATLLTNIAVLQALAKQIDPNIQILKCAIPFFTYMREQDDLVGNFLELY